MVVLSKFVGASSYFVQDSSGTQLVLFFGSMSSGVLMLYNVDSTFLSNEYSEHPVQNEPEYEK